MNMCEYCHQKGMTLEEYKTFKSNINKTADAIIETIKLNYHIGNGLYHDTSEILSCEGDNNINITGFIIQALKNKEVEFFDNNTLWRY